MAWIESHDSLADHPKMKKGARMLGVSFPTMVGYLQYLWWWCAEYAPSGDVTGIDVLALAEAARYEGDPDRFVQALIDSKVRDGGHGFLERTQDGRLLVHDWYEFAGRLIERRKANAERMKAARASNVQRTCDARTGTTVPDRTIPDPTQPNQTKGSGNNAPQSGAKPRAEDAYSSEFESFWAHYPRRREKRKAYRCWQTRVKGGVDTANLIRAAANYAAANQEKDEQYLKHPATFLGPDKPFEEWIDPRPTRPTTAVPIAFASLQRAMNQAQAEEEGQT